MEPADYTVSPAPGASSDEEVRNFIRTAPAADCRELVLQTLRRQGGKCSPERFSARWEEVKQ